jgi:hypothetical protein
MSTEELMAGLERLATQKPPALAADALAAWEAYAAARDTLLSRGDLPPNEFMPGLMNPRRRRLWFCWHHPEIDPFISDLLAAIIRSRST